MEKAERNVLPILNNLLENREMQLEDGRFLMAAERYDKLLQQGHTDAQLKGWGLERVSENFAVVALGLAVPPFTGHTLDPPLRSRFQCRNIGPLPYGTMIRMCSALAPNVDTGRVNELLALVYGLNSQQHKSGMSMEADAYKRTDEPDHLSVVDTMPLLPVDNLLKAVRVWVGPNISAIYREINKRFKFRIPTPPSHSRKSSTSATQWTPSSRRARNPYCRTSSSDSPSSLHLLRQPTIPKHSPPRQNSSLLLR